MSTFSNSTNTPSVAGTAVVGTGTGFSSLGYSTTPTASNLSERDASANLSANSMISGYATTATAAGTTTLTVASKQQQYFTGSTTQTVVLPVTSTLVLGQSYVIVNNSSGNVTVQSSGANTIQVMAGSTQLIVTVVDTTVTTAAGWNAIYSGSGGAGSVSITGDSGTITGSALTIYANQAVSNCGQTVRFLNSGTTSVLDVTDSLDSTIIGSNSGTPSATGGDNVSLGKGNLLSITTGNSNVTVGNNCLPISTADQQNVAIGINALNLLDGGSDNVAIGFAAGTNLATGSLNTYIGAAAGQFNVGAESGNIYIANSGVSAESNTLRIGQGTGTGGSDLSRAFIYGIGGVTISSPQYVTIDPVTSQLGSATVTPGSVTLTGDTGSATGSTIQITALNGADNSGTSVTFAASAAKVVLNVTDAASNTIIGRNAGKNPLTTGGNTGLGALTLGNMTTAVFNASLGASALAAVTTGSSNTSVGEESGLNLLTGAYNAYFGISAGSANAGAESSNIYLNSIGVVGESNKLRIGTATGTGNQQLDQAFISGINGNTLGGTPLMVTIDSATDQLGVAAIPGGVTTINGDTGFVSGSTITIRTNVGGNNAGSTFLFSGDTSTTLTLDITDANNNTLLGKGSGNTSATGIDNTALGFNTMNALTSGEANVAVGQQALGVLQDGLRNVALGSGALSTTVSGDDNIAIGKGTLALLATATDNIAIGTGALGQSITDNSNIGIGSAALGAVNGGNNNTAVGFNAGMNVSSGSFNVYLGAQAGTGNVAAEVSNIYINSAGTTESHTLRIGVATGTGTQQLNKAFIAGINGVTLSGVPPLVVIDAGTNQLGVSPTLATAPPASATATSGFGSLAVGTARQNTLGYDILVNVSIVATVATGATIVLGVGPTNTPTTNAVTASFSVGLTQSFCAVVPAGYYCLVNTTGTITIGSITTQVCPL